MTTKDNRKSEQSFKFRANQVFGGAEGTEKFKDLVTEMAYALSLSVTIDDCEAGADGQSHSWQVSVTGNGTTVKQFEKLLKAAERYALTCVNKMKLVPYIDRGLRGAQVTRL